MFIAKAYEDKVVNDSTIMRDAVANAVGNIFRKKGKGFVQLWKHREKVDKEAKKKDMNTIMQIEDKEKGWIDLIYRNAGLKKPNKS